MKVWGMSALLGLVGAVGAAGKDCAAELQTAREMVERTEAELARTRARLNSLKAGQRLGEMKACTECATRCGFGGDDGEAPPTEEGPPTEVPPEGRPPLLGGRPPRGGRPRPPPEDTAPEDPPARRLVMNEDGTYTPAAPGEMKATFIGEEPSLGSKTGSLISRLKDLASDKLGGLKLGKDGTGKLGKSGAGKLGKDGGMIGNESGKLNKQGGLLNKDGGMLSGDRERGASDVSRERKTLRDSPSRRLLYTGEPTSRKEGFSSITAMPTTATVTARKAVGRADSVDGLVKMKQLRGRGDTRRAGRQTGRSRSRAVREGTKAQTRTIGRSHFTGRRG